MSEAHWTNKILQSLRSFRMTDFVLARGLFQRNSFLWNVGVIEKESLRKFASGNVGDWVSAADFF